MKFLFIQKLHAFNVGLFNRFMAQRTLLHLTLLGLRGFNEVFWISHIIYYGYNSLILRLSLLKPDGLDAALLRVVPNILGVVV